MSGLIRRNQPDPLDRLLNAQVAAAERPGITASARIHGGAFAAATAMHHGMMLSRAADAAFKVSPMGEDVYRAILLAYGSFATTEIQRLSLQSGGRS
jgi:hypothetical protein